jgi:hypothetical protein
LLRHVMGTHPAHPERFTALGTLGGSDDPAVSGNPGPLERSKINKTPNSGVPGDEELANKQTAVTDVHNICETLEPVTRDHGADFTGVKWLYARTQQRRRRPDLHPRGFTGSAFGRAKAPQRIQRVSGLLRQESGTIRQRIDVTPMIAPQVSSS